MAAILEIADPAEFRFSPLIIQNVRGRMKGVRRSPTHLAERLDWTGARLLGLATWRTGGILHRMDTRLPPFAGKEVLTVHDTAPLRFSDEGAMPRSAREGIRRAAAVIAPSRFAADEITRFSGRDDVEVVHNGVTTGYSRSTPRLSQGLRDNWGLPGAYVLVTGGATQRKNLSCLSSAWPGVRRAFPDLVLALAGPRDRRRDQLFSHLEGVRLLGKLSDQVLPSLYSSADVYVSCSRYEGFGLPSLEALAVGTPVLAINNGVAREVCGEAATYVADDPRDVQQSLIALLTEPSLHQRLAALGPLRAAEFTWRRSATHHLDLYRAVRDRR